MEPILLYSTIVGASLYRGFEGSVFELIANAGFVVKLVLLILLFFSVVSWAIIFFKLRTLRKADRETEQFLKVFWAKKDLSALYGESRRLRSSPLVEIFRAGYGEIDRFTKTRSARPRSQDPAPGGQPMSFTTVTQIMKRTNSAQVDRLERNLSFLATTGNAAPFIGLFGTVWGIMEAFHEIGLRGATSLAIVAPGISEALIATAAGLFAAIPAVIAYNYFLNRVRTLILKMDDFTDEFSSSIERYHR
jgi:biopolymer transport protein TolQ